jgi:hypothetical protein
MTTSPHLAGKHVQPTDSFPQIAGKQDPFREELQRRLEESGLSKARFVRMCEEEATYLTAKGRITEQQYERIIVHPSTLGRILNGELEYTRLQVLLWARVLRKWYASEECLRYFVDRFMIPPKFDEKIEKSFVESAGFVTEERRQEALLRTTEEQAIVAVKPKKQFVAPGRTE